MIAKPHVFKKHPVVLEWHHDANGGIGGERVGWSECMDHIPPAVMSLFMDDEELEQLDFNTKDGWGKLYAITWFTKKQLKRWKKEQKRKLDKINARYR